MYKIFFLLFLVINLNANTFTIASYNVENLFDLNNDETEYNEFKPNTKSNWNEKSFNVKLENLTKVINEVNADIIALQEIENRDVEIELKIDGKECDPRKFFSLFWEQYEQQIKRKATQIVKEQTSEKFREIQSKLQGYEEICDSWANDINWQAPNNFSRK